MPLQIVISGVPLPRPGWPRQPCRKVCRFLSENCGGVWLTNIDSQVLFSTAALESAVNRLADLNFNTLYPTVWNWGYTLYPSATARREIGDDQHLYADLSTPELEATQGERDMMQEVVDFGHARGMAVIPWFEFGFLWPLPDYELYRRHPDWFTQVRVEPAATPGTAAAILGDSELDGGADVRPHRL